MSDLIRRMDAVQACQVGPSDEWSKSTRDGYNQAATDCAMNMLRVPAVQPDARIEALTAQLESTLKDRAAIIAERGQWIQHAKNAVWSDSEELKALTADNARLRYAIDYILDGMGVYEPDYIIDPDDDFLDAANSEWVRDTLERLASALTGKAEQAVSGAASVTTADMVKDLREKTGAGMVDAKRALTECLGDMDEAVEWLRFKGTSRTYIPKHKRPQAVAALTGKEPSHE